MRIICNFGDVNLLEYGGPLLVMSPDNYYYVQNWDADNRVLYTLEPERLVQVQGHLVTEYVAGAYRDGKLYRPIHTYREWFTTPDKLETVASCQGTTVQALIDGLTSEDIRLVAGAYIAIADTWGWDEFDHEPRELTRREAANRFRYDRLPKQSTCGLAVAG